MTRKDRIKQLRDAAKISQAELAKIVGVEQSTIAKYEGKNEVMPSPDVILKMADYFNVSLDYIMCRTNDPNPTPLVIPNSLANVKFGFDRGEFEDLKQDEVDKLAEYAQFIKSQRDKLKGAK